MRQPPRLRNWRKKKIISSTAKKSWHIQICIHKERHIQYQYIVHTYIYTYSYICVYVCMGFGGIRLLNIFINPPKELWIWYILLLGDTGSYNNKTTTNRLASKRAKERVQGHWEFQHGKIDKYACCWEHGDTSTHTFLHGPSCICMYIEILQ